MTCIACVIEGDLMVMGGDSAGISSHELAIRDDPKVFKVKQANGPDAVIGFSGSFRMAQLLMSLLTLPEDKSAKGDKKAHFDFLVAQVVPMIRKIFKDDGFTKAVNGHKTGSVFLIAYRGWVYGIQSDFQVSMTSKPYTAIGSGALYALAVLDYIHQYAKTPRIAPDEAVRRALCVAEQNSIGVRGPMKIVSLSIK